MTVWRLSEGLELTFPPSQAAGVVNVTADSFYSGARSVTPEQAVEDGLRLAEAGFDLLDVGAVAARSGPPVEAAAEIESLTPAIAGLVERSGVPVMADTFQPEVARAALDAGAVAINDTSGGSEEMYELIAERGCGYVLMHIEGPPREDRTPPVYGDVVAHVRRGSPSGSSGWPPAGSPPSRSRSIPGRTSTRAWTTRSSWWGESRSFRSLEGR